MVGKSSNTRQKILRLGEQLLKGKGLNAFSYSDISLALGVKNAAIHYHFHGKQDLLLAIIEENIIRFDEIIKKTGDKKMDVWDKLQAFLDIYISNLENDHQICLFGSLASDFLTIGATEQVNLKSFAEKILEWLGDILTEGKALGKFKFKGDPRTRAVTICATLAGGLQLARITGKQDFYRLAEQVKADLNAK